MALLKLPSLQEIWANPSLLTKMPAVHAQAAVKKLARLNDLLDTSSNLPPNPVEMAIRHKRYAWMDTPHLHLLGEEVATTIETSEAAIVCMPPRHAKSTTISAWTPFWALVRDPETHILMISYEAKFAAGWGTKARRLVATYGAEYGLELNPKKLAGNDWELTTGGGMMTVGALGGVSGKPAKILIVDDAISGDEAARSKVQRDQLWEWWDTTVVQRIEPDSAVFVVGTRWHEDDLIGRLIKWSDSGEGIKFRFITMPALAEEDDILGRSPGQGLWCPKFPQEWYEKRRSNVSAYTWNAVNQQRPSPPGGNMVDPEWWRYYKPTELPELDQEIQTWDLALDSLKKTDSYQCGIVSGRKGTAIYLRDAFHEHCDINKVKDTIYAWNRIYPKARQKLVERAVAGPAVVSALRHHVRGMLAWPPKGRQKNSKEGLLNACVPDIRAGQVYLPENADGTRPKWVQEFIEELRQFPRAPHDDYVDAFTQGMDFLLPASRGADRDAEAARARGDVPVLSPEEQHKQYVSGLIKQLGAKKLKALERSLGQDKRNVIEFPGAPTVPESTLARFQGLLAIPSRRMC